MSYSQTCSFLAGELKQRIHASLAASEVFATFLVCHFLKTRTCVSKALKALDNFEEVGTPNKRSLFGGPFNHRLVGEGVSTTPVSA